MASKFQMFDVRPRSLCGVLTGSVLYHWSSDVFPTEAHILEDVNKCIEALQHSDPETLDRTAGAVRGRVSRVDNVVTAEMENYEPGPYTETVKRAVHVMRESSKFHENITF